MRIAIFSDSHGRLHNCFRAIDAAGPIDHIIHLGDTARDAEDLMAAYPHIPVTYVCGNNDFCAGVDTEKWLQLGDVRLFICHGHSRSVKAGLRELFHAAKGADLVLFGHTHEAFSEAMEGIRLFNPGSISRPASRTPSFGILVIEGNSFTVTHRTPD